MRIAPTPALGLVVLALCCASAQAQEVRLGGYLSSQVQMGFDSCLRSDGECRYLDLRNTNVLGIRLRADIGTKVAARVALDFRNLNFPEIETLDDTGEPEKLQPISLRVQEGYIDLYGFILRNLDLRIGAQKIRWGVGDGISPTDRLNPYDLEDPTVFDRRLATVAALAAYQVGKVRIELAVVPFFVPAALPVREVDFALTDDPDDTFDLDEFSAEGQDIELEEAETNVSLPETSPSNTAVGVRVLWNGPIGDLGASFYHGRDSLPQADGEALLTGFATDISRVDVKLPIVYPRVDVIGLEYRGGPFGKFTFWGEAAVVFPQRTVLVASRTQLEALERLEIIDEVPDPLPEAVTQDGRPYLQGLAGVDLTLDFGLYFNLQYLRGFPTERRACEQSNYILSAIRYTFPGGKVILSTSGGVGIGCDRAIGYTVSPELSILFGDAVTLIVGATWLGGTEGASLREFRDLSHVRLGASVEF